MNELAQRFSWLRCMRQHASMMILLGTICLVLLPSLVTRLFWVDNGRSRSDLMVFAILPGIQSYLMLFCSVALARKNPQLGAPDYKWVIWSRSEFVRVGLLPLGVLLIAIVISPFISIFHLSHRTTVILHNIDNAAGIRAVVAIQYLVLAPLLEEVFWRGHVQSILGKVFGAPIGVIGQAMLFAMTHMGPMLGLIDVFLLGLLFGIWRHRRNTLLPLIVTHIINNALYVCINWF